MNTSVAAEHPAESLLQLTARRHGGTTVIAAEGELDMASVPQLQRLLDEQSGPVLLDLRSLEFIDSCGLGLLLSAEKRSRRDGLSLRLAPGRATQRLLQLTGLTEHFAYTDPPDG